MHRARLGNLRSVLCLGAHPDDIEIGCAGTLLRLLAEHPGLEVHWSVLSGEGERVDEARRGAEAILGTSNGAGVSVQSFRDSLFPYDGEGIKEYLRNLRSNVSPDLILTHRRDDLHQDHRTVSELTWNIFRDHLIVEYEIPKYDGDLGTPNLYVALDDAICERKIEVVTGTFTSQRSKPWFSAGTFWALLRLRGIECNSPSGFAEGLYCRKMMW